MAENKRPDDAAPAPAPIRPMTPEELRQAEQAEQNRIAAEVAERDPMNGPEGGRYVIGADAQGKGGTVVDADGNPVKDKKKDD
jgi:hypothetical protein